MVRARQQAKEDAAADDAPLLPFAPEEFQRALAKWYRINARVLPWRGVDDAYKTWLSEIMLQQTRVATVIERYLEFLERFPTIAALADADESAVLALWSGLGYYRRARMLHRGAQFVMRELGGQLPHTAVELRTLPGVGDYTSAAIASIAFHESVAVVDGNVERVLLRILGQPEDRTTQARARLARVAQSLVPPALKRRGKSNPAGDHNQAMMELGATICLPRAPLCLHCPVVEFCRTRGEHSTPLRGKQKSRTVAHLLALRKRGVVTEVLLERRPQDASLMAGMLELPPLPLDAVAEREPVLRLRHAITNTNYYVHVYAISAVGEKRFASLDVDLNAPLDEEPEAISDVLDEDMVVFVSEDNGDAPDSLLEAIPAAASSLAWGSTARLHSQPLTGLTRKTLRRMGVMAVPKPRIR